MRARRTVSMLLIMLLLSYTTTALMGMFLIQKVKANPDAVMWVTPQTTVFEKGSTFSITIWLNDTADESGPYMVKAWALTLNFDNSVINLVSATEGPYLKTGGNPTAWVPVTPGSVPANLACVITSYTSVDGPGELATVTFEVLENGRTAIDLKDTALRDLEGLVIPMGEPVDGVFYTTYPKARFYYLPSTTAPSGVSIPFHLSRDPFVNETVTFNATAYMFGAGFGGSYDPNTANETNPTGNITNYRWDFNDGNITSGDYPIITHSFNTTNSYRVNLTVTDDEAKSSWYRSTVQPIIRDVGISSIEPAKPAISPGGTLPIKVNITNYGSISGSEYVNVTLYYNNGTADTLIPYNVTRGMKAWSNLHENDPVSKIKPMLFLSTNPPITLNYTWQTSGLPLGSYTIWANISQVTQDVTPNQFLKDVYFREMDLNLANNNMTWGKVEISLLHDIAITRIDLTPTLKSPNIIDYGINQVTIKVRVENIGDSDETFNVTLHQDSTLLREWTDEFLASKTSKILEYIWATSALSRGYYNLIAQASNATGEAQKGLSADNKLTLIAVITSAPVATFTYLPAKPLVGGTINIDATASQAAPGWFISTYTWRVNGTINPTLTTPTIELRFVSRAVWNVTLTVTDTATVSNSFSQLIHVGSLPLAQFTFTPKAPKVDQTITFNASASLPDTPAPAGDEIKTYTWDFGDGQKVVYTGANLTETTTHSYAKSGNFSVTLKVFDGDDFNSTIIKFVLATKISSGVTLGLNAQTIEVGQSVTISGQVTPTRAGAKVSILYKNDTADWTILQNVTSDAAGNYQHIWTINKVGNYTVKARFITDDKYAGSESQTATIQVQSTSPPPPDWTPYIIGGGIVIIVVIAVAVYLLRRRK